jgi:hypothetical protein
MQRDKGVRSYVKLWARMAVFDVRSHLRTPLSFGSLATSPIGGL